MPLRKLYKWKDGVYRTTIELEMEQTIEVTIPKENTWINRDAVDALRFAYHGKILKDEANPWWPLRNITS